MRTVYPHEFFRLDFEQILVEARRQETIHPANKGEYTIAKKIYDYFDSDVFSLVAQNDWVYDAASRFASDYAIECFHHMRLAGERTFKTQTRLQKLNSKVEEFIARAFHEGAAPQAIEIELVKASDFLEIVQLSKLPAKMRSEAQNLHEEVVDHEALQMLVTIKQIVGDYETLLPRIMYVVRRVEKVRQGLPKASSDNDLLGMSASLSWYEDHISVGHTLYPVLGKDLRGFYKVARNVGSHHEGFEWKASTNEVILTDRNDQVEMHAHDFQKKYRYLSMYVCDFGMRGLLAAFCQREKGAVSNSLVREYVKIFPEDFPGGEMGVLRPYTE